MDISPFLSLNKPQPLVSPLREGVLLMRGLMNNLLLLPAQKSLWVELVSHMPMPSGQQLLTNGQAGQKFTPQPSWQPLLNDQPLELMELKLPSGQKIWAATLHAWFARSIAHLPPKALLEVKPTADGQLKLVLPSPLNLPTGIATPSGVSTGANVLANSPARTNSPAAAATDDAAVTKANAPTSSGTAGNTPITTGAMPNALADLWRKNLPVAQSPKLLLQLMAPLLQPLAEMPDSKHPLHPIQQYIARQNQHVSALMQQFQSPDAAIPRSQIARTTQALINGSGVLLETKLRNALTQPAAVVPQVLSEILSNDFKAQLLKSIAAINTSTPHSSGPDGEWPDALWHLFLGDKETTHSSSTNKNAHWLLLETLLPTLQKTLAGIQLQQTHSLAEQAKHPGALVFELVLPSAEGLISLAAQLIPQPQLTTEEDAGKENNSRAATASWRLFLEFNLPNNGLLAVQFLWQPGLLRGKVWANQPKLKAQLKDQLKQLKQALKAGGIDADQLILTNEMLSKPAPPVNQPLVDIKT